MIGIIVCVIVFVIIVILSCPGLLTMVTVTIITLFGTWFLLGLLKDFVIDPWIERIKRRRYLKKHNIDFPLDSNFDIEQQKAIDEWEKKWRKRHPSRIKKS